MADNNLKTNLDWALSYAKRGWKVFPLFYVRKDGSCSCGKPGCLRKGKHPRTRNGLQDASCDLEQVERWWVEDPRANIGLAAGHGGLIVVDVDEGPRIKAGQKVGDKVGLKSLEALVTLHGELPKTLVVQTGNGGRHYYFLTTEEIKNSAGAVAEDIDIRGSGGYCILPPSNHAAGPGHNYKWLVGPDALHHPADMPTWLEAKCLTGKKGVDISGDIDPAQNAEIQKSLKGTKFSPEQLVKLLDFIPADCDRDTWWQVGAALKKELGDERGWQVWNAWSQKAPEKYDPKTATSQWESFVDKGLTGGTIFHFAKENGFRGFDIEAADAPEIRDNNVWIDSIKRFVELPKLLERDREQFDCWYAPLFTRGNASGHVLKNESFRRVEGCTYWPNQPQFVVEVNGRECLNYWHPSDVAPAPGDVSPFLKHVAYLFPKDKGDEANILLDYLAFQVQHPGEKVHWAVLLEGDQGNGKSYFASVMRIVLGDHNVKTITSKTLHEHFTGWQRNTQFIIVEEMMAKERLEMMNLLKPAITEPWAEIREMYKPPYSQPNRFNFLFFSNYNNALLLDNTDRRYCILTSDAPPHPESNGYYGPLFDWTRSNGPALAHYLGNRPLTNLKPKAHAPMTAGKMAMIRQSMLPIDQFIDDAVRAKEYPCQWDLIRPEVMVKPLKDVSINAAPKDVSNAFQRLGYLDLGKRRTGKPGKPDDKVNMWAVRDFEMYQQMSGAQLRQIWMAQVNGTPKEPSMETVDALLKYRPDNPVKKTEAM